MLSRFFLLVIFLLSMGGVLAKSINVCTQCKPNNIEDALNASQNGDTILVEPGRYLCESLEVRKSITLIGKSGAILDGNGKGYVLKLLADHIKVTGFKIINSDRSHTKDYAAIYVFKSNHFQIINNEISKSFFGLLLEKSTYGTVKGNKVFGQSIREDDSGNGIHLWHCSWMEIVGNEVYGMRDGIYLEFVEESLIRENYTHTNVRYGLHFMFSNHDSYEANIFENNGAGVAVMFSKWIRMEKNRFPRD